jgi:hypothetical protein
MSKIKFPKNIAYIIRELELNGYIKEANDVRVSYIKTADSNDKADLSTLESLGGEYAFDKASDPLTDKIFSKFKGLEVKPGAAIKGFGAAWLTDLGANYALDYFESSKGPYKVYQANKGDLDEILETITSLIDNPEVDSHAEQIKSLSENGLKSFENAKKEINDTTGQKIKTSYNNSEFNKSAARGFTKKRIPSYLREALIGSLSGAAGGAFLGGIGAIPGAIVGGLGSLGYEALTDLWYESISSTGKAYLQAKDALMKSYKMYDALKDIDLNTANQITDKVNGLMKNIESLNLNNKEKSGLENLIQQLEQSAQSGISEVKERVTDKVTENAMPILQGIANEIPKTVYERLI